MYDTLRSILSIETFYQLEQFCFNDNSFFFNLRPSLLNKSHAVRLFSLQFYFFFFFFPDVLKSAGCDRKLKSLPNLVEKLA